MSKNIFHIYYDLHSIVRIENFYDSGKQILILTDVIFDIVKNYETNIFHVTESGNCQSYDILHLRKNTENNNSHFFNRRLLFVFSERTKMLSFKLKMPIPNQENDFFNKGL